MFTSDTVEHDVLPFAGGEEVAVYNLCTDTTRHMNGIVTNMHPSEGVWLFRSPTYTMLRTSTAAPDMRHATIQVS